MAKLRSRTVRRVRKKIRLFGDISCNILSLCGRIVDLSLFNETNDDFIKNIKLTSQSHLGSARSRV